MLTLERLHREIEHTLGINALDGRISALDIVNEAGEWWAGAHRWNALRSLATLTTDGTEGLALPANFRELIHVTYTSGLAYALMKTDMARIFDLRSTTTAGGAGSTFYAVQPRLSASGAYTYWLEFASAPPTGLTVEVLYRPGWQRPVDDLDSSRIAVPPFCEGLFVRIVRAWARGTEEEDVSSRDERLSEIVSGPEWAAAVRADMAMQINLGQLRGGAVQQVWLGHGPGLGNYPQSVPNP